MKYILILTILIISCSKDNPTSVPNPQDTIKQDTIWLFCHYSFPLDSIKHPPNYCTGEGKWQPCMNLVPYVYGESRKMCNKRRHFKQYCD